MPTKLDLICVQWVKDNIGFSNFCVGRGSPDLFTDNGNFEFKTLYKAAGDNYLIFFEETQMQSLEYHKAIILLFHKNGRYFGLMPLQDATERKMSVEVNERKIWLYYNKPPPKAKEKIVTSSYIKKGVKEPFTVRVRLAGNSKIVTIPKPFRDFYEDGELVDVDLKKREKS